MKLPTRRPSVLVIEDDFLQAQSTAAILRDIDLQVVGPFGDMAQAMSALRAQAVDCVLTDLDLGSGPEFAALRQVSASGTPVVLVTGYGPQALPSDILDLRRVEKPFLGGVLVEAVTAALQSKAEASPTRI